MPNAPVSKTWVGRITWSLLRNPMKRRGYSEKNERLITQEELLRFNN